MGRMNAADDVIAYPKLKERVDALVVSSRKICWDYVIMKSSGKMIKNMVI